MLNLRLDTQGKLVYLQALPAQVDDNATPAKAVDWNSLFAAAGLDAAQFQSAAPQWTSLASTDTRAAWTGKWPGSERALRIEAGAWRGKPVFFRLIGPWTRPERMRPFEETPGKKVAQVVSLTLFLLILVGASALVRYQ